MKQALNYQRLGVVNESCLFYTLLKNRYVLNAVTSCDCIGGWFRSSAVLNWLRISVQILRLKFQSYVI